MKDKVKEKYPDSYCVKTRWNGYKTVEKIHCFVWSTLRFWEKEIIGIGNTQEEAWENAFERLL